MGHAKHGKVLRQRVKRRLPFAILDRVGNVLVAAVLIAVPAAAALQLAGAVGGGAPRPDAGAVADLVEGVGGPTNGSKSGATGGTDSGAASGSDGGAAGLSSAQEERARNVLNGMSKDERKALYERYEGSLDARGITPGEIEKALDSGAATE